MTTAREIFSRVLSQFKTLFWRSISAQSHCFQVAETVHVWSGNVDDDRCGRMATTVIPENVSRVESLIKKDPKMTHAEIQDIT